MSTPGLLPLCRRLTPIIREAWLSDMNLYIGHWRIIARMARIAESGVDASFLRRIGDISFSYTGPTQALTVTAWEECVRWMAPLVNPHTLFLAFRSQWLALTRSLVSGIKLNRLTTLYLDHVELPYIFELLEMSCDTLRSLHLLPIMDSRLSSEQARSSLRFPKLVELLYQTPEESEAEREGLTLYAEHSLVDFLLSRMQRLDILRHEYGSLRDSVRLLATRVWPIRTLHLPTIDENSTLAVGDTSDNPSFDFLAHFPNLETLRVEYLGTNAIPSFPLHIRYLKLEEGNRAALHGLEVWLGKVGARCNLEEIAILGWKDRWATTFGPKPDVGALDLVCRSHSIRLKIDFPPPIPSYE